MSATAAAGQQGAASKSPNQNQQGQPAAKTPPATTTTTTTTKATTNYKTYLFNLADDPYEAKNLLDDPSGTSSSRYTDVTAAVAERHAYYAQYITDPDPPVFNAALTAFRKCAGVCSYVPTTADTSSTKLFAASRRDAHVNPTAPHIVFVLVDDWGINDPGWKSSYLSWTTPNIDRLAAEGIKLDNYYSAYYWCVRRRAPYFHPSIPSPCRSSCPFVHSRGTVANTTASPRGRRSSPGGTPSATARGTTASKATSTCRTNWPSTKPPSPRSVPI